MGSNMNNPWFGSESFVIGIEGMINGQQDEEDDNSNDSGDGVGVGVVPQPELPEGVDYGSESSEIITEQVGNGLVLKDNLLIEAPPGHERRFKILKSCLEYYRWTKGLDNHYPVLENQNQGYNVAGVPAPSRIYLAVQNSREVSSVVGEITNLFAGTGQLQNLTVDVVQSSEERRILDPSTDLIICPVEIILSEVFRRKFQVSLHSAILIFDDGHELERMCYEEGSIITSNYELRRISTALGMIRQAYLRAEPEVKAQFNEQVVTNKFLRLERSFRDLADWVKTEAKGDKRPKKDNILGKLADLEINENNLHPIWDAVNKVGILEAVEPQLPRYNEVFEKFKKFLNVLCVLQNSREEDYLLRVIEDSDEESTPVLKIILANAALIFPKVEGPALSVIVGGDCLAPLRSFRVELGVTFHRILQFTLDHNLNMSDKYFLRYCELGPRDQKLNLNYKERGEESVLRGIAESILELCRMIPGGVVVLFHSFRYFKNYLSYLHGEGMEEIWSQITEIKEVFQFNGMDGETTEEDVRRYRQSCRNRRGQKNGALLLIFVRDPLIKKYDLEAEELRGAIFVSIPFSSWAHNEVTVARREYFKQRGEEKTENMPWHKREAFRVMNQAFGKIVRGGGEEEWGAVVVLDSRMDAIKREPQFENEILPAWVCHLKKFELNCFERLRNELGRFVATHDR